MTTSALEDILTRRPGRSLIGNGYALVWVDSRLLFIALWGRVGDDQVAGAFSAETRLRDAAYDCLLDATRVSSFELSAVAGLLDRLSRAGAVRRRAIVRPGGVPGALVAGAVAVHDENVPSRVFATRDEALSWLERADAGTLLGPLDQTFDEPLGVARVRAALDSGGLQAGLDDVAHQLGVSGRTLQRELSLAATSFKEVQTRMRLEAALALLSGTDLKLAAVAARIGFRSVPHFATFFRRATGVSPGMWRRTRGRDAGRTQSGSGAHVRTTPAADDASS